MLGKIYLDEKEMPGTRMQKKRRVTYKDSFKGYNTCIILQYYIHFLHKILSLWIRLVKFQSISIFIILSQAIEYKRRIFMYQAFLFSS